MTAGDLLCFSHLRWNFVFQRPNHLMSRFARQYRVHFIEEPVFEGTEARLERVAIAPNLIRVVPYLPAEQKPPLYSHAQIAAEVHELVQELCSGECIEQAIHWYYTPLMLRVGRGLSRSVVVYDCMDELANFLNAPAELIALERELMAEADVVFTGGMALYQAKRGQHRNVHGVPSSVDVAFFERARSAQPDPGPQAEIPHPRVGYCGVIDERVDLALLGQLARARPLLQFVMVGPVVKIDPESLPQAPNIHYLGAKPYQDLPSYLAGWDAAIMPFALNEATRFISPTKTPEYLAAGKRVVSTAITDVVEPYERLGLVRIGRDGSDFIAQLDAALADDGSKDQERDRFLANHSWDTTWKRMHDLVEEALSARRPASKVSSLDDAPAQQLESVNESS
jgi:glycosyltransferase involved in cell wall biosynthesis